MHHARASLFVLALVSVPFFGICTVVAPQMATAQDTSAEGYYAEGIALVKEKKYNEAAEKFVLAFSLDPNVTLAFNAARAYENDGNLEKARVYYNIVLKRDPPPNLLAQSEASLERISKALERIQALEREKPTTLTLNINANDPQATVYVDGKKLGRSPQSFTGQPGSYTVEILRKGYEPFYQTVSGDAGSEIEVVAALEETSAIRWGGWTGIGLSAAGLGLGLASIPFSNEAQEAYDEAQDVRAQRNPETFNDLRTQGESDRDTSTALVISGSALGAVGVSLFVYDFFLSGNNEEPQPTHSGAQPTASNRDSLKLLVTPQSASFLYRW